MGTEAVNKSTSSTRYLVVQVVLYCWLALVPIFFTVALRYWPGPGTVPRTTSNITGTVHGTVKQVIRIFMLYEYDSLESYIHSLVYGYGYRASVKYSRPRTQGQETCRNRGPCQTRTRRPS